MTGARGNEVVLPFPLWILGCRKARRKKKQKRKRRDVDSNSTIAHAIDSKQRAKANSLD